MDSRDKEFLRRFQKLAPEWQRAIVWMIENEDLIAQFANDSTYTKDALEADLRTAMEKEDYLLATILLYKRISDEQKEAHTKS